MTHKRPSQATEVLNRLPKLIKLTDQVRGPRSGAGHTRQTGLDPCNESRKGRIFDQRPQG